MNPLDWIAPGLDELTDQGLRRQRRERTSSQGATVQVNGRELINLASNDYLGLAGDPRLAEAAIEAISSGGVGSGASPLVSGYSHWQRQLEEELAALTHRPRALLFPSGFAANVGAVTALVGPTDAVLGDKLNHASLIDGCRLSGAYFRTYRHGDLDHLAHLLEKTRDRRRRLIVTDSIFSMDGDLAPLPELAELAARHGAMLLVDEAHATGVFGSSGAGLVEQTGCDAGVHVHVGTLSKALGVSGGFVTGSENLIEWLIHKARGYVYSTAAPAALAAAALSAVQILRNEPDRRRRLLEVAQWFRGELNRHGWRTGDSQSQIIPILVGDASEAVRLAEALDERGFWIPAIRPPTVPPGTSRLRISLTAETSMNELRRLVEVLASVAPQA